jgi:hypothetical protein
MFNTSKNISIPDLQDDKKFRLLSKLHHNDIVPFVFKYITKINPLTIAFYIFNVIFLGYTLKHLINILLYSHLGFKTILLYSIYGLILFPIILIPIHELIHGLVYLAVGAKRIKFGTDLTQFIFFVIADQYVAGKKDIMKVAFTPFIIISILLILGYQYLEGPVTWSFILCLLVHSTMCIGDFSMASFFVEHPHKKLFTYDDINEKSSYFYEKIND